MFLFVASIFFLNVQRNAVPLSLLKTEQRSVVLLFHFSKLNLNHDFNRTGNR